MSLTLNCIAAVSENMGIGNKGKLPWPPLKNEFKHFQKMTSSSTDLKQNVVIMGRKTWFSLPIKSRPLNNRINLVLSRHLKEPPRGAHFVAKSIDHALEIIIGPELKDRVDKIWIIGGRSVYEESITRSCKQMLFLTRILQKFECDTYFPEINLTKYKQLTEFPGVPSAVQEENGIRYKFEIYEKKT
ncbi:dihydrofolate reductase [Vespertilionid gammaherpesvirus 1]|uniref:Viral dihydrofolate reductase n=1 Tax=Vespertilionid gammaherpesvirus 1 TaxID=2560830 RepID=A0A0X9XZQ9_9GAMA|nr:dihydrofolate reductase [Myotis gammaherpesvirus 8]AMA67356.1 dihydrofolate reductase [Vespertilionid gammaherpesvirus 1]